MNNWSPVAALQPAKINGISVARQGQVFWLIEGPRVEFGSTLYGLKVALLPIDPSKEDGKEAYFVDRDLVLSVGDELAAGNFTPAQLEQIPEYLEWPPQLNEQVTLIEPKQAWPLPRMRSPRLARKKDSVINL